MRIGRSLLPFLAMTAVALPAVAHAETTIIEPMGSHFPYQRWIGESLVPTPDVTVEVIEQPLGEGCPSRHGPFGYVACTVLSEHRIWIAAGQIEGFNPKETFLHEIGHYFAAEDTPEWARSRFYELYDLSGPWEVFAEPQPLSPEELYAEVYPECAEKPYITQKEWNAPGNGPVYGSWPIMGRRISYNKTCRMIRNL